MTCEADDPVKGHEYVAESDRSKDEAKSGVYKTSLKFFPLQPITVFPLHKIKVQTPNACSTCRSQRMTPIPKAPHSHNDPARWEEALFGHPTV